MDQFHKDFMDLRQYSNRENSRKETAQIEGPFKRRLSTDGNDYDDAADDVCDEFDEVSDLECQAWVEEDGSETCQEIEDWYLELLENCLRDQIFMKQEQESNFEVM